MEIIDAQVHTWEKESAKYPWLGDLGTPERTAMVRREIQQAVRQRIGMRRRRLDRGGRRLHLEIEL